MNFNYIKIALRILMKYRSHTLINIAGLGLGFSVSMLMMIYVYHQLSFDNFHKRSDDIYRFTISAHTGDGKELSGALTGGYIAREVSEKVPEVESACRVFNWGSNDIQVEEKRFTGDKALWADSTFFRIFDFQMISGNPQLALKDIFSVVLTESVAKKYFGTTDAVGKSFRIGQSEYNVTGIMEDVPHNSHLRFDMLASFHSLERPENNIAERNGISFPTYVLKKQGADENIFKSKTIETADDFINEIFNQHGLMIQHSLQPLSEIYLHSDFSYDTAVRGDIRNVWIFSFLALIVILVAVFNFMNLVTAQSEKRMREIGVRKVMGAGRKEMIFQFMGESIMISLCAFVFALLLNEFFIHPFSHLIDEKLRPEYWHNPMLLVFIVGLVILTGIMAGFYPAVYLSRFNPVKVLKGVRISSGSAHFMRKVLVVFQFAISIFLVVSVLLLNKQVNHMKNMDLGFDRENVISVRNFTPSIHRSYQSLKSELLQHPRIVEVAASQSIPGEDRSLQNSYIKGDDPSNAIMMYENRIQEGYLKTFGLRLVAGRDFDPTIKSDTAAIIINQAAARKLGLDDPVGKEISVWNHQGKIIGVVANYNFQSLHNEIDPLALTMYVKSIQRISIRFTPGNIPEVLDYVKSVFETVDSGYTFEYSHVDDMFASMYNKEERVNKLITAAAILAIIISFMGLYALTSFTISKRIKEIGIRRTLGASVAGILAMLFRDLSKWVVIGNLIAWPVAFYVVMMWIENFAFRIDLWHNWFLFVLSGMMAALVGILATLLQALSAARANPVNSLKTE
jgi:putative ABC transport system permease protein